MSFSNAITVLSIFFNSRDVIGSSLSPFLQAKDIIFIDNASTNGSVAYIKSEFREVTLIENDKNPWLWRCLQYRSNPGYNTILVCDFPVNHSSIAFPFGKFSNRGA